MRVQQKLWGTILFLVLLFIPSLAQEARAEAAQVSGLVWLEKTVDGAYSNESPFSGAKVTLEQRGEDGALLALASVTTEKDGRFDFSVSAPGEYRLRIELPEDYLFTLHGAASSALPAQGNQSATPFFTLTGGQYAVKNIGVTRSTSYISLVAFEDENANGGRMQSEPLLKDVLVELLYEYEGETYVIASDVTDRKGEASIRRLSPGTYRIRATLPGSFVPGPLGQKVNSFYNCIIAGEGSTGLSAPFTLEPKSSLGMGIGAVKTGSVEGKLWFDENYNGVWDANERGLTEASVLLHSDSLGLTRETRADESGGYAFTGLQPGAYRLEIRLPDGMIFTYPGHSLLSEIAASGTLNVTVQVDTNTALGAIGAMPAAALYLSFYQDLNLNGQWDEGENALPGAAVAILQGGAQVDSALSDENGGLRFSTLRGGEAQLVCALPEGYIFAPGDDSPFFSGAAASANEAVIAVEGTEGLYTIGVTMPAAISGQLFEDPANTGVYQAGYALLAGFTVQAVNESGQIALETLTDEAGRYTLAPLLPGEYTVRFLLDDPYIAAPYAAGRSETANHILAQTPEYGETETVSLAPGQTAEGLDGGVFRAGVIDGSVLLSGGQGGMAGVVVTLLDEYGAPFSDYSYGETDENGYFSIKGALPGTYSLLYTLPADSAFTLPMTEQAEYQSDPLVIGSGSEIHMPALEGVYTATLSGWVTGGGRPISAHVTLRAQNLGTVYETETLPDGQYVLSGLRPDSYELTVTLPEGYIFGEAEGSPLPAAPVHQASGIIAFAMGEARLDANINAALPASLSGVIYYDANLSATLDEGEAGAEARVFSLWRGDTEAAAVTTDADGAFTIEQLVPGEYVLRISLEDNEVLVGSAAQEDGEWLIPVTLEDGMHYTGLTVPLLCYASISGQVWSLDGTLNGVEGIPVTLLDADGAAVGAGAANAQGAFAFDRLLPGEYSLSAALPEGYLFAREQDAVERESCVISLADGTPHSIPFRVEMGDDLSGKDIGMGAMGAIGDHAWLDENGNGMQDLGEPDMPGILIELYQHGEFIASTTTDVYGRYSLSGLYPGEYEMRVTMHAELKATLHQTEFPLVASILPESDETTVTVTGVIVPSGGRALHYDLGFQLRKKGVYPAAMDGIPTKDWRPYSER